MFWDSGHRFQADATKEDGQAALERCNKQLMQEPQEAREVGASVHSDVGEPVSSSKKEMKNRSVPSRARSKTVIQKRRTPRTKNRPSGCGCKAFCSKRNEGRKGEGQAGRRTETKSARQTCRCSRGLVLSPTCLHAAMESCLIPRLGHQQCGVEDTAGAACSIAGGELCSAAFLSVRMQQCLLHIHKHATSSDLK